MTPTAVIVDVDGTLCDVTAALHHLHGRRRDFEAFHQATARCPSTPRAVEWCLEQHSAGHTLVVVTARRYQHEALTRDWLDEHLPVSYLGPLMRGDDDHRDDAVVKREIHRIITEDYGYRVVAAIDDRPRVIALWRSMGIPTTAVHRPDWEQSGEYYDPADVPGAAS